MPELSFVGPDRIHELEPRASADATCALWCPSTGFVDPFEVAIAALERRDLALYSQAHPLALSGGQKQRRAIVDGCLSGKELLIFDEPTSGLDYAHMLEVSCLLRELAERGLCVLVITHDGEFLRERGARAVAWLSAE